MGIRGWVAALAGVAACGGGGSRPALTPDPEQLGSYAYEVNFEVVHRQARGTNRVERIELRGVVEVDRDTLYIDARHGLCHPAIRPSMMRFVFQCDEYTLSFDRRRPTMSPRYSGVVPVTRVVQGECAEWRVNPNGTRTCIRYDYHDVPGTQHVGGMIRIRPIRGTDPLLSLSGRAGPYF